MNIASSSAEVNPSSQPKGVLLKFLFDLLAVYQAKSSSFQFQLSSGFRSIHRLRVVQYFTCVFSAVTQVLL
jgi:hypothetical protein